MKGLIKIMNVKLEHPHLAYIKCSTLSILPIGRGLVEKLGKRRAFLINRSYDTSEKKIKHSRCYLEQGPCLSPGDGSSLLQLRNSRTSFHPPLGTWCWWAAGSVTLLLGNPEQAKGTAPLFTASFLPHAVLTRNPQQTTTNCTSSLCSQTSPRSWHLWSSWPGAQHSKALLAH